MSNKQIKDYTHDDLIEERAGFYSCCGASPVVLVLCARFYC